MTPRNQNKIIFGDNDHCFHKNILCVLRTHEISLQKSMSMISTELSLSHFIPVKTLGF